MTSDPQPNLKSRLLALAAFLLRFESPGFQFGEWSAPTSTESGDLTFPYFAMSETAQAFINTAYENDWVTPFDWVAWKETAEAARLRDDRQALARATPDQLARLLTTCIRQERFVEGELATSYESGLLSAILKRARALAEQDLSPKSYVRP